ncbi:MAG TPA: hypothetical protein PLK08_03885, partial [Phycisphaerae bacterium]|nr:hypothetical protein [Phycisphaerae bacterium]
SLAVKSGGTAAFRMFFQPCLSRSDIPEEVLFQAVTNPGGVAIAATSREVAFVGMPVFFR